MSALAVWQRSVEQYLNNVVSDDSILRALSRGKLIGVTQEHTMSICDRDPYGVISTLLSDGNARRSRLVAELGFDVHVEWLVILFPLDLTVSSFKACEKRKWDPKQITFMGPLLPPPSSPSSSPPSSPTSSPNSSNNTVDVYCLKACSLEDGDDYGALYDDQRNQLTVNDAAGQKQSSE